MNPYESTIEGTEYTWVYRNATPKSGHTINFQWLRWQGSEFNIKCEGEAEAITILKKLKNHYAPTYPTRTVDKYTIWEREIDDFETEEHTILPEDVVALLGDEFREKITITFRSLKTNQFTENMNFKRVYGK